MSAKKYNSIIAPAAGIDLNIAPRAGIGFLRKAPLFSAALFAVIFFFTQQAFICQLYSKTSRTPSITESGPRKVPPSYAAARKAPTTAEIDIKASMKKFYISSIAGDKRENFQKIISGYRKEKAKAGPSYSLFVLGLIKELAEEYRAAIDNYDKLIKLYRMEKYANLSKERISECYLALGERDAAIENYQDYYKWRISEGKREQIIFKIAEIYNQTLTTLDKIIEAYKMSAARYEFSKNETVEYLVGYFKGFHLLDAHLATLYYRRVLKEYPDGLYKFEALFNMSLIYAYDLSDIETAKTMLIRLLEEKSEYADEASLKKIRRRAEFVYGLLSQFHSPELAAAEGAESYKKVLAGSIADAEAVMAAYYLGYYYEHLHETQVLLNKDNSADKYIYKKEARAENYLAEIKNAGRQKSVHNAISSYLLGYKIGKDQFYAEECALRACLMLINYYNDTVSCELIAAGVKKNIKEPRRSKDFEDLSNKRMPGVFDKSYSPLFAKEKKLYESSEFKKAILTHEQIIEKSHKGPEAEYSMYTIARIYEEDLKEYEMAVNAYRRFINEFPDSPRADKAVYQIAKIYETALVEYNEAIRYYNKLIEEGRDQLWIYQAGVDLAGIYSLPVFKKSGEAVKIYQGLLKKVPMREDEVLFKLAEAYEADPKQAVKAVELCEKIVKKYPGSMYFDAALDRVLGVHYKENLSEISKQVILAKEKKEGDLKSILEQKLEKEIFIKNYKDALETIDELKKTVEGTDAVILLEIKAVEIQIDGMGEVEKGVKALREMVKKTDEEAVQAEILFLLAKTIAAREKDYKTAADIYERIINMKELRSKTQMMALFEAGLIYAVNLKYYEDAFRCYSMIMSKYEKEARAEKLDAKIANLLNIELNVLQNYLRAIEVSSSKEEKDEKAGGKYGDNAAADSPQDTGEAGLKKTGGGATSEAGLLEGLYNYSEKIFGASKPAAASDGGPGTVSPQELIDEEFGLKRESIYDKESEKEISWFQKPEKLLEYSWFQKPVDLSDIGIGSPGWFKKGGLALVKPKSRIDEETYKLRSEMSLPPVKSSKTNKYLSYIEANPGSPKLPIIMILLANSYEESANFEKAVDVYKDIAANHAQYPKLVFTAYERQSAIMAKEFKQYERALFVIRAMQEKFPQFFNAADALILNIENYRKIAENEKYISENIGDEKSLELMYENAKIYEEKFKDYPAAISYLNKCSSYVSGDTDEIKYKLESARICEDIILDYALAYEELNDILERFPGFENEAEVIYRTASLLINELKRPRDGIKLLEKFKTAHKTDKNYKDAMILLQSAYDEKQIAEKVETIKTLREVIPELKLSDETAKEFKRIEVEKKVVDFLKIIETSPEDPGNYHYLYYAARLYEREAEEYEKATVYYRKMIDSKVPPEVLIKGITSLGAIFETKINKPKKAIELYREFIVKNQPEDVDFLAYLQFKIGECYELLRKRDEAIDAYRKVKFYFPISRWAKTGEDRVAQIVASPDKFITIHEQELDEDEMKEEKRLADLKKGTFEVALETGEISLSSAEIEIAAEKDPEIKIEKLEALINTLPEKDPKLANFLIELSKVCEQTKKLDKAAEALKRVIENFPKYPRYFDVALKLAEMYRMANNLDEAVRYYRQIVQESPQYDKTEYVRYTLGALYVQKQEYIYALEVFQELIDRYQDSLYAKKAQYEKGLVNERYMKDYDAAIRDFENMVNRYFDHENAADAQIEIGWIYENAKYDLPQAKQAYQKALDRFPNTHRRREIIESIERINTKLPRQ
jgi:tetratricopeptide (TPR) repeat protein